MSEYKELFLESRHPKIYARQDFDDFRNRPRGSAHAIVDCNFLIRTIRALEAAAGSDDDEALVWAKEGDWIT